MLVCLFLSTQAYAYTITENGEQTINTIINNTFNVFNTNQDCYYFSYPKLYKYTGENNEFILIATADSESQKLGINKNSYYFAGENDIYTFSNDAIYKVSINGEKLAYEKITDIKENLAYSSNLIVSGRILYYHTNKNLAYLNLYDGKHGVIGNTYDYVKGSECRYKDGIIVIASNQISIKYIAGGEEKLLVDSIEHPIHSIAYDNKKDLIYALSENNIYAIDSNGVVDKRIFENNRPRLVFTDSLIAFGNNIAKKINFSVVSKNNNPIKVVGLQSSGIINMYNEEHPDAPAIRSDMYIENTRENLGYSLLSKNEADIYFTELHYGIDKLNEHGFVEPLGQYTELKTNLDKLYPYIKDAISKEGEYYYVPYNVYSYCLEVNIRPYLVNKALWNTLELEDMQVPESYSDLIDFLVYAVDNPDKFKDISIIESAYITDLAIKLKLRVINQESLVAKKENRKPNYSSSEILSIFDRIDMLVERIIKNDETKSMFFYKDTGKFLFLNTDDILSVPVGFEPMPLFIRHGEKSPILAGMTVAFINKNSDKKEAAAKFLNYYLEHLDDRRKNYYYEDSNINIVDKTQEQRVAKLESIIKEEENILSKLKDQSNIDMQKAHIEELKAELSIEQSRTDTFNPQALSYLKENISDMIVLKDNLVNAYNFDFQELLLQFFPYGSSDEQKLDNKSFLEKLDTLYN